MTEMGEYLIGAYLKMVEGCQYVDYNAHLPGTGLTALGEIDVIGFNFDTSTAYLCEVVTHILGLLYGSSQEGTVNRILSKFRRQKQYARARLSQFKKQRFMLWSPVVHEGYLTKRLRRIDGLEIIINKEYARRIEILRQRAATTTHNDGNPAFRLLQILEHMR